MKSQVNAKSTLQVEKKMKKQRNREGPLQQNQIETNTNYEHYQQQQHHGFVERKVISTKHSSALKNQELQLL